MKPIPALLAAAALLLAGANTFAAPSQSLGASLAGDACQLDGNVIVCAGVDAGTLRIAELSAVPASADAVFDAAVKLPGGISSGLDTSCNAHKTFGELVAFYCTSRSNSWPRVILVRAKGTTLAAAEGLPSMLPVLAAATRSATGTAVDDASLAAATEEARSRFGDAALKLGAADLSSYKGLIETARLYGGADNYAGAEDAYRRALTVETRLFGADSLAVGETLIELALQVSNQSRFDEATALFLRADPIIQASASSTAQSRLASYRALDAANRRDYDTALKYARAATALRRAEVDAAKQASLDPENAAELTAPVALEGELAHSLRIEAEMALRLNDTASAQAAAEEALWIITEEPGLPIWWRPEMVSLMGEVNAAQGRVIVAERDFRDALALDVRLFGDTAPTARAHMRLGRFYTEQQLYTAAVASYRSAFAILAKDPIARAQIVPDQIVPFLTAAAALGAQDATQKATLDAEMFQAAQLVTSGMADRTIAGVAAREAAGDKALSDLVRQLQDAQARRDHIRLELAAENAKSNGERSSDLVAQLESDLKSATAAADSLQAKVAQAYPSYARLADPGPVALADFQKQLGNGEAFLTFVTGAKGSFALLVTANRLTAAPLAATTGDIADDVSTLRAAFTPKLGRLGDFNLKVSYGLYQKLVAPIAPSLAGVDHLIVAPGDSLSSLPLSLLVSSDPGAGGYGNAAWLVRRFAISQVPSPRALVALRAERSARHTAPKAFLGVGNPVFSGNAGPKALSALAAACQQGGVADPALLRALPPLPNTAAEVQSASRSLGGGTTLLGASATEAALRGEKLDQYAVLYFATHGLLPGEMHCQAEPGLVLTPPSGTPSSAAFDGILAASEIAALKLNADLVVLSACNTAATGGTNFGGGALEGLADSFFNAGARAVLASHWEVPSAATEKLMTGVFARYGKDRDLAEALRQSQLALIAQSSTAHPFNWAAFTLIGDAR
ncbi:MAG: CHAT domain-containing protein [Proteobacteria bacterium]|nr:CHAT domain-containing protein [Pseudomonadota bacterium]